MIACPYCKASGWCMKATRSGRIRAGYTHRSRIKLWHRVLSILRGGLT